jgi:hypothetical protein
VGWYSRTSGSLDIREKRTNSTSSILFLIANYVPKLHVYLAGLGAAAWVQLDRYNQEDSKTGQVGILGRPVLQISGKNGQIVLVVYPS